jgi:peptide/nickel transport system permease protein
VKIFILRRGFALIPILFGVSLVTFLLILLIPGNPSDVLLPADAPASVRAAFLAKLHLNDPPVTRYIAWLSQAVHGNFGLSIAYSGYTAGHVIWSGLKNTFLLVFVGGLLAVVFGTGLGMATAWWSRSLFDRVASAAVVFAASMPGFWVALVLGYVFGVRLGWLPTSGIGPTLGDPSFADRVRYLVLPSIAVALLPGAQIARVTRTLFLEIKNQDFIVTLRTRGYSKARICRHIIRNAAAGVVNITGLQIGYLFVGTLFVEVVFAWPGIGLALQHAIDYRDYPVLQGTILVTGVLFCLTTFVTDIAIYWLEPRGARSM